MTPVRWQIDLTKLNYCAFILYLQQQKKNLCVLFNKKKVKEKMNRERELCLMYRRLRV